MVLKSLSLPIQLKERVHYPYRVGANNILYKKIGILFETLKRNASSISSLFAKSNSGNVSESSKKSGFNRLNLRNSRLFKIIFYILIIAAILLLGVKIFGRMGSVQEDTVEVKSAVAQTDLNQEFSFPLRDENSEEISRVKYILEKAELRDEIIVKGKRARSVKGRIFLIINLKIVNEYSQSIEINTKDYIRLSVNGNKEEWLAPEIHNDPVEVQAISTKYTRIGFPINSSDKDLVLRIGEINEEKQEVILNLE